MDFYCKVKLADGSDLMIEDVFRRLVSMDWIKENAGGVSEGFALFEAFGANEDPYMLIVDLNDASNKSLVRIKDQKVIFRGKSI